MGIFVYILSSSFVYMISDKDLITRESFDDATIENINNHDNLINNDILCVTPKYKGSTITFKTNSNIEIEKIPYALNSKLKKSIVIKEAVEVEDRFHSRYNCKIYGFLF